MRSYVFVDCDIDDDKIEYDICGKDYIDFIKECCKKSEYVSFIYSDDILLKNVEIINRLENFRVNSPEIDFYQRYEFRRDIENTVRVNTSGKTIVKYCIRYYKICDELCNLLCNAVTSIYQWIDGWGFENPEDPVFYRGDGSIFLYTLIHEGELTLLPLEDEDVSSIVDKNHWIKWDKPGSIFQYST